MSFFVLSLLTYNLTIPIIIASRDTKPVERPTISCMLFAGGGGFLGTYISLPGFTAGWLLKKKNDFLVPFTVPLAYTI